MVNGVRSCTVWPRVRRHQPGKGEGLSFRYSMLDTTTGTVSDQQSSKGQSGLQGYGYKSPVHVDFWGNTRLRPHDDHTAGNGPVPLNSPA